MAAHSTTHSERFGDPPVEKHCYKACSAEIFEPVHTKKDKCDYNNNYIIIHTNGYLRSVYYKIATVLLSAALNLSSLKSGGF